jgi:hypothetical protein
MSERVQLLLLKLASNISYVIGHLEVTRGLCVIFGASSCIEPS